MSFSIIKKSQLEGAKRIDAEYYQPEYLDIVKKISLLPHSTLDDISESLLSFGAYSLTSSIQWKDSGIPFITAEDVKNGYLDLSNVRYIDEGVDEILKKSRVHEGEILLAMSGKVGDAAVALNIPSKLNSNQDIVKIKLKNDYSPYFLVVFLNSRFGRMQVLRLPVGSVQQHIFLWQTKSLLIPKFSKDFILKIENLYKSGLKELENSKRFYSEAENLLLKELGLKDFQFEDDVSYIVNFSDIKPAQRIDAEYFNSKISLLINKLMQQNHTRLTDSFEIIKSKAFEYIKDDSIGVIKTKQLSQDQIIFETESQTSEEIVKREKLPEIQDSDVIFASMGVGSLGKSNIFYKFETDKKYTIDSTLKILRKRNNNIILPEVLNVFINSKVGQKIIYKYVVGSSGIISIYDQHIKNIIVPLIDTGKQQKIANLIRQSHESRKKSKELLERAKREVEEMIEKSSKEN